MNSKNFVQRHLHYQVLYQYSLLEQELAAQGREVPRLPLKEPATLLQQIKALRATLRQNSSVQVSFT